jgi:phosphate transport system substrate-binding protein
MRFQSFRHAFGALLGLAAATTLVACNHRGVDGVVKIDGSSTVYPVSEAVAELFQKNGGAKVSVAVSGTGGGFEKFCTGKIDISNASRPIQKEEADACRKNGIDYIEVPVAYDGLAMLVNPKNDWVSHVTTDELKAMWEPRAQGSVTKWSQVRAGWPDKQLHLYGPGVASGTYDYFTEAIIHEEHSSRNDYTASEDDDFIVNEIARDELSFGFVGYAYFLKHRDKLKILAVDDGNASNGAGPIVLSVESVRKGTYQPFSRPVFIYVSTSALEREEVRLFVTFYLERGARIVAHVGYMPLPTPAYALGLERVSARRTGSLFHGEGSQVGLSIDSLLQMSALK